MNPPQKATRNLKQTLKFQRILFLPEKIKLLLKGGGEFPQFNDRWGCFGGEIACE